MRFVFILATLLACGPSYPAATGPAETAHEVELREQSENLPELTEAPDGPLPRLAIPRSYNLVLDVDPRQTRFSGEVEIEVELAEATQQIWFHGEGLEVARASLSWPESEQSSAGQVAASYAQVNDEGVAELRLDGVAPPGVATITIEYEAPFGNIGGAGDLHGLYRVDENRESYAFTQMEPTSARRMLPCFDDPGFKTPFTFTVSTAREDLVFFNTPAEAQDQRSGRNITRFATTRPLPTYLLALAVGPLEVVEEPAEILVQLNETSSPEETGVELSGSNLRIRGIATQGNADRLEYALSHTREILHALEAYFGAPYPYEKLDIVAVPDFAAGAMENPGLITFRDSILLDVDQSPYLTHVFSYVMAHEIAHQWFGNLVTPVWWDDLWLNEAFASWLGYKIAQEIYPEQRVDLRFLGRVLGAMEADSRASARQIRQPIESHHDIVSAFDAITYRKGGAILRMVEQWIGPDVFRDAVRNYIHEFTDKNATYEDLLAALESASGENVRAVMTSFLFEPGLPLVTVSTSCEDGQGSLTLRQERFIPLGGEAPEGDSHLWALPICLAALENDMETSCVLLSSAEQIVENNELACADEIAVNPNGEGYFRFAIGDSSNARLASGRGLPDAGQVAALDSIWAAYLTGQFELEDAIRVHMSSSSTPAQLVELNVHFLEDLGRIDPENHQARASRFVRSRTRMLRRAFDAPSSVQSELTTAALLPFALFEAEDRALRRTAHTRARRLMRQGDLGQANMSPAALAATLRVLAETGGADAFDAIEARFDSEDDPMVRRAILTSLVHTPEHLERALMLTFSESLRTNERMIPLSEALRREALRSASWSWLKENYGALERSLGAGLRRLFPSLGTACDSDFADELSVFFTTETENGRRIDSIAGGPRALAGAQETIARCSARRAHYLGAGE